MRKLVVILFVVFQAINAHGQAEKSMLSVYTTEDVKVLVLDFDLSNFEIVRTESADIEIMTLVSVDLCDQFLLEYQSKKGRYTWGFSSTNGTATLTSPEVRDGLASKGKICKEKISAVLYVPDYIMLQKGKSTDAASLED